MIKKYETYLKSTPSHRDAFLVDIHRKHFEMLYFFAVNLCLYFRLNRNNADELLQQLYRTLTANWELHRKQYAQKGLTSLFRILKTLAADCARGKKSRARIQYLLREGTADEQTPSSWESHLQQFLRLFEEQLSQPDTNIMRLYIKGYSYKDIAWIMKINEKTLGARIRRIREHLHKSL